MSNNENSFINNEQLLNKKRKLENGNKEESHTELAIKNHIHKSPPLLRKRISDSEFNFNVTPSTINHSLTNNWEPISYENELASQYQIDTTGKEKVIINEPPDVPIIEEFDEKNEIYPFFNAHTLQYEFTSEGIIKDSSSPSKEFIDNSNDISTPEISNDNMNGDNNNIHRQESSLIPFKQDSQIILFNNNSTGQVVLYNKASKSLSIHKVRPGPKEIMSRNKRCILCNQLLPSERERMNNNNIFKNHQAYTDAKYFRLLACSLSYASKRTITSGINNNNNNNNSNDNLNESSSTPIRSINSAENIINLLNDNSRNGSEYMNHPAITLTNSNVNLDKNEIKEMNENENENKSKIEKGKPQENNDANGSTTYLSNSSFNNGYYERFFIERKKLGRGFRGSVFLCHHVLDQVFLGEYAIKKVAVGNNHQWLVRMLKEVMLLEKLRNPNIIEYKHAWLEEHTLSLFGPKVPCLFILMERANGGNLEEYVQLQWNPEEQLDKVLSVKERIKRKRLLMKAAQNQVKDNRAQFFGGIGYDSFGKRVRYLTTEAIWKIFLDICYGLNHLHELGIIHRDLKPPNLLLQYKDPNNQEEIPKVLISDFGECEILSHIEKRERTGATGTLEFMAPELLISDETGHYYDDYSSNSDLWSLGVVLYYICFSEMPYSQVDDIDILKNEILNYNTVHFKNDNNSTRVPKELKSLIKKLMVKKPTDRPKAKEILELYGGYKDGTPIKIDSNIDITSKQTLNQDSLSASSSLKNMNSNDNVNNTNKTNDSMSSEKNKLQNNNNNNNNNIYISQFQNTSILKNKLKEKEKDKDKEYEEKNESIKEKGSVKNDNKNNNDNNTFGDRKVENENLNRDEVKAEKEEEDKEWLDKDIVDEPLSFKAEKRIVPFNHNRSKSLPYIPNVHKENIYSKDYNNSIIQNAIEEEKNETPINDHVNESSNYQSEKSIVPFYKYTRFERPLPSPSYPPLKNNEKELSLTREYQSIRKYSKFDQKEYSKKLIKKGITNHSNRNENKSSFEDLVAFNSIYYQINKYLFPKSNLPKIWNQLTKKSKMKKLFEYLFNQNLEVSSPKNKKKTQSIKGWGKKKSFTHRSRHTYRNSKIYFSPHHINHNNNINPNIVKRHSSLIIKNDNKLMKFLKQKCVTLNILLFSIKAYVLYQTLYPYYLFFIITLLLIIYKSNILRHSIYKTLLYSLLDFSFLYIIKQYTFLLK